MLKVELKKGFVGITADGRKVTVIERRYVIGPPPWIVTLENVAICNFRYSDCGEISPCGPLEPPEKLRIVAPYPSERPIVEGKLHYVLDT
jgi:hypothetical protein